jgi:RNA polymerase sigma-70 factor (ECF subfamily)
MTNRCIYKLKYGYFKYEHPSENPSASSQINPLIMEPIQPHVQQDNREMALILEKSLQNLPVIYRTVFILRETEGFSTEETAELLDITPVNVKVRLNRAKNLLQKEMELFYRHSDLFSFNLVYCTALVEKVFDEIKKLKK